MNGGHDMGGLQDFGPVLPEHDEPLFHAQWEKRALAMTLALGAGGQWNIDLSRAARETLPSATYLASSYYEIWIRGLVTPKELCGGIAATTPAVPIRTLHANFDAAALARGSPTELEARQAAQFAIGDRVVARNMHPIGDTRLPRYVRGHTGTVALVHGAHVFADRHAARTAPPFDEDPQWLYTVVFDTQQLWGTQADASARISADAWEPYLVPA